MANDIAKMIAGYVNVPSDLRELYHDIKTRNLRLNDIDIIYENIKSRIYEKGTNYEHSISTSNGIVVSKETLNLLTKNNKYYSLEHINGPHIEYLVIKNSKNRTMIEYARSIDINVKYCKHPTIYNKYNIMFDWSHWQ